MNDKEKENVRHVLEKCLDRIKSLEKTTGTLISYLHRELGTEAATELLDMLNVKEDKAG